MKALDLFCGAGGASTGLHRAGFEVVGIDIKRQPRYPFTFIQADALDAPVCLDDFDFVWASPPCQAFSRATPTDRRAGHPDLVEPVRAMLKAHARAWCIENVLGAPLRPDLVLDGTMFPELRVVRQRVFELSFFVLTPPSRRRPRLVTEGGYSTVFGNGGCPKWIAHSPAAAWHTGAAKRAAMGIDWMSERELSLAIPPAYSEWIAQQYLRGLRRDVA